MSEFPTHHSTRRHETAILKSNAEYDKFQIMQKKTEQLQSLNEIENDIKALKMKKRKQ